jgi:hypothetical protein
VYAEANDSADDSSGGAEMTLAEVFQWVTLARISRRDLTLSLSLCPRILVA